MVLSFSPSTPKLVNFPNFLTCTSLRKTWSTPKVWEKNMSTPKLVNFPHFLTCTSLRKTCQHQKFEKKHVNTKTSPFSLIFWLARVWEKHVNTKTSQFSQCFWLLKLLSLTCFSQTSCKSPKIGKISPVLVDSRRLKKHVNTKTSVEFSPFFGFQEFEKNMSTLSKLVNFLH